MDQTTDFRQKIFVQTGYHFSFEFSLMVPCVSVDDFIYSILILMDLKMPVMGGIEATKILKQQFPEIPIIAQTAYSLPEEKESALKAGSADFLNRPIKKKELIEMIDRYVRSVE